MYNKKFLLLKVTACASAVLFTCMAAQAGEREDLEALRQTTIGLVQALVEQGFLTRDKADQLLKQAQSKATVPAAASAKTGDKDATSTIRVPYVPEIVRQQIANQVREEVVAKARAERWGDVNAVPEWVDRVKVEGEIRVGVQNDAFAAINAASANFLMANGQNIPLMDSDRARMLMRARLGVSAKVSPEMSAALRMTTGSTSDPLSTSQTLGNYGNKINFSLDRAFLRYHDSEVAPWLTVTTGRMPNPWLGTELLWNENLGFDGLAVAFDPAANSNATWRPFAGVGAFPLQDVLTSSQNNVQSKWLYAAQGGVEWIRDNTARAKVGLGYYNFYNVSGVLNPSSGQTTSNLSAPGFRQKGNTLFDITNPPTQTYPLTDILGLAAEYKVMDLTAVVDLNMSDPIHVIVTADYLKNVGFDQASIKTRSGQDLPQQDSGYLLRAAVGMPTMLLKGDWQASLTYRYLEADAVLDAFNDNDFHLGGTNNKGYVLGFQYGLGRGTWMTAKLLSSNEISGPPLAINTLQVYVNAKF